MTGSDYKTHLIERLKSNPNEQVEYLLSVIDDCCYGELVRPEFWLVIRLAAEDVKEARK